MDENVSEIGHEIEKLDNVYYDSDYSLSFGHYDTYKKPNPDYVTYYLRNLGAQGILNAINGIIVGKPQDEEFYEEYKAVYLSVLKEFNCENLPIIYNVNIGHAVPIGILPLGIEYEIDLDKKIIRFSESAVL